MQPRFSATGSLMRILAIDTAADRCDTCIYDTGSGRVLAEAGLGLGKGHAEHLIAMAAAALHDAAMGYDDLDAIAVTVGPGSFTGVRVGVAAARGFALALDIPAIGVTTLEGIAAEARIEFPGSPVLVAIDARRGEIYAQMFDGDGTPHGDPLAAVVTEPAALGGGVGLVLAGSGAPLVAANSEFTGPVIINRASPHVATVARFAALKKPPHSMPKPLYLRAPDAKIQAGFAVARSDR